MLFRLTALFGWINLVAAALALVALPFLALPANVGRGAVIFIVGLQVVVSAALVYASRQRAAATDIGEKAYPACVAAYILWAVMALNWFG